MYAISAFLLGTLFIGFIGIEAVAQINMPLGLNLQAGDTRGAGTAVFHNGIKMFQDPLWQSIYGRRCWIADQGIGNVDAGTYLSQDHELVWPKSRVSV